MNTQKDFIKFATSGCGFNANGVAKFTNEVDFGYISPTIIED